MVNLLFHKVWLFTYDCFVSRCCALRVTVNWIENLIARRVSKISFYDHLCPFDPIGVLCCEILSCRVANAHNQNSIWFLKMVSFYFDSVRPYARTKFHKNREPHGIAFAFTVHFSAELLYQNYENFRNNGTSWQSVTTLIARRETPFLRLFAKIVRKNIHFTTLSHICKHGRGRAHTHRNNWRYFQLGRLSEDSLNMELDFACVYLRQLLKLSCNILSTVRYKSMRFTSTHALY